MTRERVLFGGVLWCWALACGGPASSAEKAGAPEANDEAGESASAEGTADDWVEEVIEQALWLEVMPGTTEEPDDSPERRAALRTFFLAHPEYREEEKFAALGAHACGLGTVEDAHAHLENPPPKTPVTVADDRQQWVVFIAHSSSHCTSDDWAHYSSEGNAAAKARGAVTAYAGPTNDMVLVVSKGQEVARIPVEGQGFTIAKAGTKPASIAYDPSAIVNGIETYLED